MLCAAMILAAVRAWGLDFAWCVVRVVCCELRGAWRVVRVCVSNHGTIVFDNQAPPPYGRGCLRGATPKATKTTLCCRLSPTPTQHTLVKHIIASPLFKMALKS